jgi:hypothetical protein
MQYRWVSHHPRGGNNLVVNSSSPNYLVATYFMTSGVPITYNLAIHGAYIQQRHSATFDSEVLDILRRWTRPRAPSPSNA